MRGASANSKSDLSSIPMAVAEPAEAIPIAEAYEPIADVILTPMPIERSRWSRLPGEADRGGSRPGRPPPSRSRRPADDPIAETAPAPAGRGSLPRAGPPRSRRRRSRRSAEAEGDPRAQIGVEF